MRFLLISIFIISFSVTKAQIVNTPFDVMYHYEPFLNNDAGWLIQSNSDNLLIIQDSKYILERYNGTTPFFVTKRNVDKLESYSLRTIFKVNATKNNDSYFGIVCMLQDDNKGGFLVEFSKPNRYRIKQLTGGNYQLLTGDNSNKGWLSLSLIKQNKNNEVEIKVEDGKCDIFINDRYLTSLRENNYKAGKTGYVLGPDTKAEIDVVELSVPSNKPIDPTKAKSTNLFEDNPAVINFLKDSLVRVQLQLDEMKKQNDRMKEELVQNSVKKLKKTNENLVDSIRSLQNDISQKNEVNNQLIKVISNMSNATMTPAKNDTIFLKPTPIEIKP